jgi:TPR repeat protein
MKRVAESTSSEINSPFDEEANRELPAGNCADVLSSSAVCKSWRKGICSSSELLAELRFSIDEDRPFTRQHYNVAPHMLRFISCPPFPLLVRTAASNRNATACFTLAALLDLQHKRTSAMVYWKEAAAAGFRRAQLRVGEALFNGSCDLSRDGHASLVSLSKATRGMNINADELNTIAGETLLEMGRILFDAHGKSRDKKESVRLLERVYGPADGSGAVATGSHCENMNGRPPSQFSVHHCPFAGRSV